MYINAKIPGNSQQARHIIRARYLSLPWPFTPDLKLVSFTYPFLHSHSDSFWTAFTNLEPVMN